MLLPLAVLARGDCESTSKIDDWNSRRGHDGCNRNHLFGIKLCCFRLNLSQVVDRRRMADQGTPPARNSSGKAVLDALLAAGPDILARGRDRALIISHGRQSAQRRKLPYAAGLSRGFGTLTSLEDTSHAVTTPTFR